MDIITRDIRLAGFNYNATDPATPTVGACTSGGRPVGLLPQDQNIAGADTGPDRLSLVVPVLSTAITPWTLAAAAIRTAEPRDPIYCDHNGRCCDYRHDRTRPGGGFCCVSGELSQGESLQ